MSIDHWETLHQFGGPSHVLVLRRSLDKGHLQLCSLYDVEYTYQERDTCQQHVVPSHRAAGSIESNGAVAIGTIDNSPLRPQAPKLLATSIHIIRQKWLLTWLTISSTGIMNSLRTVGHVNGLSGR